MKPQRRSLSSQALVAVITILYCSLLVGSRSVDMRKLKLQKRANDYKVVWERQKKIGPPLSPTSDQATLPKNMGPLNFYQKECEVGMFDNGPGDDFGWSGQPLSGGHFQEGTCLKVNDLKPGLGNKISAYVVTGYCECEFFDDSDCQTGLFSAFNRADSSLKSNGPHDNMIESIRCKKRDHIDDFVSGSIHFEGGEVRGAYNRGSKVSVREWNFEVRKEQLYTDCVPVPDVFPIRYYKINGVTCDFFERAGCTNLQFTAGHAGKVDKKYSTEAPKYLRSFKCYPPYGVMWDPRDDR
ncbi:hypothetical protein AOL_s00078g278 [Orbilia oligospora ATCC 24927]|uniref:Uncharacterized protein n=2 Tax=Orbilia oligospora TaxID=2813651 RepID=G1XBI1_ARTOA|nr:hypothetical protein AOL_s00078g278 [Orbilia oligospora ATCC 24927]EGX49245.1 hypothetical protein AOL_s00078g278 [Orbilia oligospora ATCC 24927]KAF3288456.1 hypothetical protein TWF970_005525 [Orbilia oligospora]